METQKKIQQKNREPGEIYRQLHNSYYGVRSSRNPNTLENPDKRMTQNNIKDIKTKEHRDNRMF